MEKLDKFARIGQHFQAVKNLPGVADVISGDDIDIVVLEHGENKHPAPNEDHITNALTHRRVKLLGGTLKGALEKMGIDITQVAFTLKGRPGKVLRPTSGVGGYEHVGAGSIGLDALRTIGVEISDEVGSVIPANLYQTASSWDIASQLLINVQQMRRLLINPSDVKIGAKFEIETQNSVYHIVVDEGGNFVVCHRIDGSLPIGTKLHSFGLSGELIGYLGTRTSPITTMRKL